MSFRFVKPSAGAFSFAHRARSASMLIPAGTFGTLESYYDHSTNATKFGLPDVKYSAYALIQACPTPRNTSARR